MVTRRQVRRAIELHQESLSAHPGVIGIGAKWDIGKTKKGEERQHAVAVYVSADGDVSNDDNPIPSTIEIPARSGVHTIPIVMARIGEIEPETSSSNLIPDTDEDEELFYAE